MNSTKETGAMTADRDYGLSFLSLIVRQVSGIQISVSSFTTGPEQS
jgi:hypothetical protein